MSPPLATSRWSQIAVVAAAAVFGSTYGLSAPLIAQVLSKRGLGETVIGLNAAMYALGVLAVGLWLPQLAARFGIRKEDGRATYSRTTFGVNNFK